MTKTFKRTGQTDRKKDYRTHDKRAFRIHFRQRVSLNNTDGLDDIDIPNRKVRGKLHYQHINTNEDLSGMSVKDIVGDSSHMRKVKEKFYNNARIARRTQNIIDHMNEMYDENDYFLQLEWEFEEEWRKYVSSGEEYEDDIIMAQMCEEAYQRRNEGRRVP